MIYFGTKEYMQWIKAPAINMDSSKQGYQSGVVTYLNGGAYSRRSATSAKKFSLSWNLAPREQLQPILDYADGIYGSDKIYFCNPFVMDKNMLPAWWAAPSMGAEDGPLLVGDARPDSAPNGDMTYGYPSKAAVYTVATAALKETIYLPIPPGYTAWVGVHGEYSGTASVKIIPYVSGGPSTAVAATALTPSTDVRVIDEVNGTGLALAISGTGSVILNGVIVQMLPTGRVPATGRFLGGGGQSGMDFISQPVLSEYNAAMNLVGINVELIETEPWL